MGAGEAAGSEVAAGRGAGPAWESFLSGQSWRWLIVATACLCASR